MKIINSKSGSSDNFPEYFCGKYNGLSYTENNVTKCQLINEAINSLYKDKIYYSIFDFQDTVYFQI